MEGFKCMDGKRLNSLKDLALSLEDMNDNVFMHHVNDERNDFVPWVREMGDNELSEIISNCKDKETMMHQIMKYMIQRM